MATRISSLECVRLTGMQESPAWRHEAAAAGECKREPEFSSSHLYHLYHQSFVIKGQVKPSSPSTDDDVERQVMRCRAPRMRAVTVCR